MKKIFLQTIALILLATSANAADFVLKLTGTTSEYLDGTGNYSTPSVTAGVASVNSQIGAVNILPGSNVDNVTTSAGNVTINASTQTGKVYHNCIFGLMPEQILITNLRFYAGSICNDQASPTSILTMDTANYFLVDLTTNGPLGLDTGTLAPNDSIQFYMITNTAGTATTIVGSKSVTDTGVSLANLPGYTSYAKIAKIPFAIVYHGSTYGFPDWRVEGWGGRTPKVLLTNWDKSNWKVLSAGTSTTYAIVDLFSGTTRWLPDASRLAKIMYVGKCTSGTGGELDFKIAGTTYEQLGGMLSTAMPTTGYIDIVTNSIGQFWYKVPTGCQVDLYVLGYTMGES